MIRVILTDDHLILREGLRQLLDDHPDLSVVAEAGNIAELFDKLRQIECDVLVLDITLPGRTGLDALKELRTAYPKTAVLILTMYPEEQYALRAIRLGAAGYLTKESAPDELVKAIHKVNAGGKYISESLAEHMAEEINKSSAPEAHALLSDREYEVMVLMGSGYTLSGIAAKLSLSVKTISTYRSRLLHKMGMRNNAELTAYAIKKGLVNIP